MKPSNNSIFSRIFSGAYVHEGVNVLQRLMYRLAFPLAALLNRLRFSPNQITTASLIFSVLACAALVFDPGYAWFIVCWGVSILLDFSDGTVARMSDRVSKSVFRYDHMSDLFKVSLLMLGVGLRYDDSLVWALAISACFTFLYRDALNRELRNARDKQAARGETGKKKAAGRRRDRYALVAWVARHDWMMRGYKNLVAILFTVSGHTLLLFLLFPFGREFALAALAYLILVELLAIRSRIARLVPMRR